MRFGGGGEERLLHYVFLVLNAISASHTLGEELLGKLLHVLAKVLHEPFDIMWVNDIWPQQPCWLARM